MNLANQNYFANVLPLQIYILTYFKQSWQQICQNFPRQHLAIAHQFAKVFPRQNFALYGIIGVKPAYFYLKLV